MSTLSGSLNSSATALVSDFIVPLSGGKLGEATKLKISRLATGFFGVLQIGIAAATYWRGADQSVVERVLAIAAFTSGPMLGLYLLAVLTPRVNEAPALTAFLGGLGALTYIAFGTAVWWPWYAVFGSLATLAIGWLLSWTPLNGLATDKAGD
jgi:Na+/proline symporter